MTYTLFIRNNYDEELGVCYSDEFQDTDKSFVDEFNTEEELSELLMEYFPDNYDSPTDAMEEANDLLYWIN